MWIVTKHGQGRRIPDVTVVSRSELQTDPVTAPLVVVEIASTSTRHTDTVTKLAEYTALPTLQHYVILEQRTPAGTLHSHNFGETWTAQTLRPGDVVALRALDVRFPLVDCYADLPS